MSAAKALHVIRHGLGTVASMFEVTSATCVQWFVALVQHSERGQQCSCIVLDTAITPRRLHSSVGCFMQCPAPQVRLVSMLAVPPPGCRCCFIFVHPVCL